MINLKADTEVPFTAKTIPFNLIPPCISFLVPVYLALLPVASCCTYRIEADPVDRGSFVLAGTSETRSAPPEYAGKQAAAQGP